MEMEMQIAGESLGVSETTVESWIERIKEFVKDMTREISGTWMKVVVFQSVVCKGFSSEGK